MSICVVIVNYNSGSLLAKCLQHLSEQTLKANKIIVVDNHSSDGSLQNLPELENLQIIKMDTNVGFARANNIAARHLGDAKYLVLLNPDAFPEKEWLSQLVKAADNMSDYAFFGSQMVDAEHTHQLDGTGDEYHISGLAWRRHYGRKIVPERDNASDEIFSPCAGAALYRKACFDELGGFDEDFFCYMEDVDFGFRLQLAGYKGIYIPEAVVHHMGSAITGKQSDFSIYYGHRNLVWVYFKNMPWPLLFLTLPMHVLLNMVSIVHFALRGQGRIILKAKKDAVKGLLNVAKKRKKIQQLKKAGNAYIWHILNKKIFNLRGCDNHYLAEYSCTVNESGIQLQNFLKVAIKGSVLAPLVYYAYAAFKRLTNHLKGFSGSRQNMAVINDMVNRRKTLLLSEHHRAWLSHKNTPQETPQIDLCVLTHNSAACLEQYISALLSQHYPLEKIRLIFVDHYSADETMARLELFQKQHQMHFAAINIYRQHSLDFVQRHDFALHQSNADYVFLSNIDLAFHSRAISEVVAMAMTDSAAVASWELRQKPYENLKYYDPVTLETSWSSHACVLIRRDAYDKVGGYEPEINRYAVDIELSYRFRRSDYILKYVPSAVVWQCNHKEASARNPGKFTDKLLANAYIRLRYGDWYDKLLIVPLQFASLMHGSGFKGSRQLVMKNLLSLSRNAAGYWEMRKKNTPSHFPFRGKHYELDRESPFYECRELEKNNLPLVSIVTRTYQGRQSWLTECVASVLNQTYPNIQHVIVEDGGESMLALIETIKQAYDGAENITYKALAKLGRSAAGNEGLAISKGQWVMFLDDDDLLIPDHVEVLVTELQSNPELDAAYALAWDVATRVENNNDAFTYRELNYETSNRYYQTFSLDVLLQQNYIPIQAILFNRALYEKYNGLDEEVEYLEDWLLWTKYAIDHQFKFVEKTTSLFRTPYAISEQVRRKVQLDSVYNVVIAKQQEILRQYRQ